MGEATTPDERPTETSEHDKLPFGADKQATLDLIAKVDLLVASPEKRALRIWETIFKPRADEFSTWDLACFCAETLGLLSGAEFPHLQEDIKKLLLLIYATHYKNFEVIADADRMNYNGNPNDVHK